MQDFNFYYKGNDKESDFIDFLEAHNLVKLTTKCKSCGHELKVNAKYEFRCDRTKANGGRCRFYRSAWKDTFFSQSNLTKLQIINLSYWFVLNRATQEEVAKQIKVAEHTVNDWYSFCREVVEHYFVNSKEILGGEGKVVEIDETKVGKRKYNKGRPVDGQWLFGGFERESKRVFIVPVPDRTKETLLRIIKENILPGTTIISDCWASYQSLSTEGYIHQTVNHSKNFVDPESGAYTQNIECTWGKVKSSIPKNGRIEANFKKYFALYFFIRRFPDVEERFHHFLLAAANLYRPAV